MPELLGTFEQMVLLAVLDLGHEAYGREILRTVQHAAAPPRTVAAGAIYTTLDRAEQKGYLTSRLEPGTPARGGRARRFYQLTSEGAAALTETRRSLNKLWRGKEKLLEVLA